jgi:hypothetical protein
LQTKERPCFQSFVRGIVRELFEGLQVRFTPTLLPPQLGVGNDPI